MNSTKKTLLTLVVAAAVALGAIIAAQNRSPLDLATAPVPPGAIRITYGSDPLQFGELREPKGATRAPVAIVIHGGCWVSQLGTMDARAIALDNMRPLAAALTDAGIATWNIEYRRVGNTGGGWPGTYQDVAAAADKLREMAKYHALDLTRVISIGHSAGGHLALWLAGRRNIPAASELYVKDPLRLTAAVNLDGPGDLDAMIKGQEQICRRRVIDELMGGSPADHAERYRAGSPIQMLPFESRIATFTGRAFGDQNVAFVAAAKKAGTVVDETIIPTAGHFVFIDPQSTVWPQILAHVKSVLQLK